MGVAKKVPQALADLGALYAQRNALYKDNYKHFGTTLIGIFPEGLNLKTAEDFNRFAIFVLMMSKLTRYGASVATGGHADSLDDLAVYAQMLREYDTDMAPDVA